MQVNPLPFPAVHIESDLQKIILQPGVRLYVPIRIRNDSGHEEDFALSVDGLPNRWLFVDYPVVHLLVGEQREIGFTILPLEQNQDLRPFPTSIQVILIGQTHPFWQGKYVFPFAVQTGQGEPGEAEQGLDLPFRFSSELSPKRISAGQSARIKLQNTGEHAISFRVVWESVHEDLEFVYSYEHPIQLAPKQSILLEAAISSRNPNWIDPPITYPYRVIVQSAAGEAQSHQAEVISYPLIPVWLAPAFFSICLAAFFALGFLWNWNQRRLARDEKTAVAQMVSTQLPPNSSGNGEFVLEPDSSSADMPLEGTSQNPLNDPFSPTLAEFRGDPNSRTESGAISESDEGAASGTQRITGGPQIRTTGDPGGVDGGSASQLTRSPSGSSRETVGKSSTPVSSTPQSAAASMAASTTTSAIGLASAPTVITPALTRTIPVTATGIRSATVVSATTVAATATAAPTITPSASVTPSASTMPSVTPSQTPLPPPITLTPSATSALPTQAAGVTDTPSVAEPTELPSEETVNAPQVTPTAPPEAAPLPFPAAFLTDRDGKLRYDVFSTVDRTVSSLSFASGFEGIRQLAVAPGGDWAAFTIDRGGNSEIYIIRTDGTEWVNLTQNAANDSEPAWSPDGKYIAFTSDREGNQDIFVSSLDGTVLDNLTQNPAEDHQPAWLVSASGEWMVVFASDRDGNSDIFSVPIEGENQAVNLTQNAANDLHPVVSVDGQIAFETDRDGNWEIYHMDESGQNQTNMTQNSAQEDQPCWSPDGQWLLFTSDRDGNQEIYLSRYDGSAAENLTQNPAVDQSPVWLQ